MSIVAERGRSGARIAPLRRNRDYLRWFTGDLLGDLGSSLRGFAMPLVTLAVGGTATASGLIGTTGRIAYVVGLLPGGVIADRTDRKRLIVTGHVLRALSIAILQTTPEFDGCRDPEIIPMTSTPFTRQALWPS